MIIKTVKLQPVGYLVNGRVLVAENDNELLNEVKEWLKTNTPEPINTQLELEYIMKEATNNEALSYLNSTDWMLLREMDGGTPMSAEVKALRADARLKII
jgi:hypothetical protein